MLYEQKLKHYLKKYHKKEKVPSIKNFGKWTEVIWPGLKLFDADTIFSIFNCRNTKGIQNRRKEIYNTRK